MKHTNKIKVFATYYFVICYLFGFSQSPSFQWAKKFGGSSNKEGNSVTTDGLGNVYTTGYFEGTTDFDPGVGVFNLTSSGSSTDIFVCKLDAAGNFLWARNFGSSSFDTGTNIKCDQNNNVVVAGNFRGTVDFDPTAATFTMASSGLSDDDVFILKLDPNGNLVWAKQFAGGGSFVNPNDLKIDPFNNVIVFGEYRGIIDLDPGAGTFFLSSQTWYSNAYLCKLNSAGNFVWGGQYTGLNNTGDNRGNSVDIDASSNIYTTGQFVFSSVVDFNMGPTTSTLVSNFYGSTYICKQDANGNFLWVKQFLGSGANNPFGIKVNTNSEIIISGEVSNTFGVIDFDPGIGTFTLNTSLLSPGYLCCFDTNGNFNWGFAAPIANEITSDQSSNLYLTGNFSDIVDFDLSPNSFTLSAPGTLPNIYICKLTSTGNLLWAQQIGNTNDGRAYSIALNSAEDAIYTTGKFQGSLVDFDPTAGVFTMNATSTEDFFIQKMSQCAPLLTSIASTSIACNSNTNGSATITANGGSGFSYTWSPSGGNAAIASGLSVGVYTCVVTNSCGSASTKTVNVTAPSPINLTITATIH